MRDGKVIAEGWHDHIGGLHAEQMAIADAESRGSYSGFHCIRHSRAMQSLRKDSSLYRGSAVGWNERVVNGSWTQILCKGNGADSLEDNGVKVITGVLESECNHQMRPFMRWCQKRPFVILKRLSTPMVSRTVKLT